MLGRIETLERRDMMAGDLAQVYIGPMSVPVDSNVGIVQGVTTRTGWVGRTDSTDLYSFALDEPGELKLRLDQLSSDIDLYLYNSSGQYIARSILGGSAAEQIVQTLSAGTYYAQVTPYGSAQSNYRVTFDVDIAGESLTTSRGLWAVNGHRTFTDWVGSADKKDYFSFIVSQRSQATLRLDQLSADVDLYLYNSSGQEIDRSTLSGPSGELIQLMLESGTYYASITPYSSAQSSYRFTLSVTTFDISGTTAFQDVPTIGGSNDWNLNAINAPEAWNRGYTGSGVIVAVLDTGVDYTHSELAGNMWVNSREIAGNGRDDDGNGFIDDRRGWDFINNDNNPMDENGHGTHVAGTIAAARNGLGSTGVAYGARIMPVQVIPASNSASTPEEMQRFEKALAAGIRYATGNGADIINLSLHYPPGYSSIVASALSYASQMGVLVVVASGNEYGSSPNYPAIHSAGFSNVISVGAYASNNTPGSFTNRVGRSGAVQVDAPGVDVHSTLPSNRWDMFTGTSMATPHVAGIAALALSANRTLTPSQLRQLIVEGANRPIVGSDSSGGVNAALTVPLALSIGGSNLTIRTGSDYAPAVSSAGTFWDTSLASAGVDAAMANEFVGPMSRTPAANTRPVALASIAPQFSTARNIAFQSWNVHSEHDDFDSGAPNSTRSAAFDSIWEDLAANLLDGAAV